MVILHVTVPLPASAADLRRALTSHPDVVEPPAPWGTFQLDLPGLVELACVDLSSVDAGPEPVDVDATTTALLPGSSDAAEDLLLYAVLFPGSVGSAAQLAAAVYEEAIERAGSPKVELWLDLGDVEVGSADDLLRASGWPGSVTAELVDSLPSD